MIEDEDALLALAKEGDVDAFNRLVSVHQNAVYGFVLRLVRLNNVADDVTQETFISAFRSIRSMRGANFRAWMMTVARNKAYDYFRKSGRRREISVEHDEQNFASRLIAKSPDPETAALGAELRMAIEHCIGRLGNDQKVAVLLIDVHGHSYEDASDIAGVSIGTVKSRLSRARRRIRDCLRQTPELLPMSMRGGDV